MCEFCFYQFDVTINDLGDQGGETRLSGSNARVTIQVTRNQFEPEFSGLPYQTTMNYTANQGDLIFTPAASDRDTVVSSNPHTPGIDCPIYEGFLQP